MPFNFLCNHTVIFLSCKYQALGLAFAYTHRHMNEHLTNPAQNPYSGGMADETIPQREPAAVRDASRRLDRAARRGEAQGPDRVSERAERVREQQEANNLLEHEQRDVRWVYETYEDIGPFTEELAANASDAERDAYETRKKRHEEQRQERLNEQRNALKTVPTSRHEMEEGARSLTTKEMVEAANELIKSARNADTLRTILARAGLLGHIRMVNRALGRGDLLIEDEVELERFTRESKSVEDLVDDIIHNRRQIADSELESLKTRIQRLLKEYEGKEGKTVGILDLLRSYEPRMREVIPRCIEDLAELIMDSEEDKWRTGNTNEILDKNGELVPENFVAWIRSRIYYYHDFNPDDNINLFENISIPTLYRSITFSEMLSFSRYFNTRVKKADGYEYHTKKPKGTGEISYTKLKDHLLFEVWLFQTSHNNDTNYRLVQGEPEELLKTIQKINYTNVFTKDRHRLLRILSLPTAYAEHEPSKEPSEIKKRAVNETADLAMKDSSEYQGGVGQAIRRALLAYYYLSESTADPRHIEGENMFNKVLKANAEGVDGVREFYSSIVHQIIKGHLAKDYEHEIEAYKKLFEDAQKEGRVPGNFLDFIQENATFRTQLQEYKQSIVRKRQEEEDKAGTGRRITEQGLFPKGDAKEMAHIFIEAVLKMKPEELNIFNDPKKGQVVINMVRDAVQDTLIRTEGLAEKDAQYAVEFARTFVHWTGMAVRNDTDAISFDKSGNWMNTKEYRLRQSQGRGKYGDRYNVFGIKRLMLNWWEGIKATKEGEDKKKSILEILQGGEGDTVDLDQKNFKQFDFEGYSQRQYTVDHVVNAAKVYEYMVSQHGASFDKFLKRDLYGRVIFDPVEADKVVGGIWHDLRYTYDLPELLWDSEVRGWWAETEIDPETKKEKRVVKFGTRKLRELVFNDEIINMGMYNRESLFPKDRFPKGAEDAMKRYMARNVFAFLMAKELLAHREWDSPYKRYEIEDVEPILTWLSIWAYDLEERDEKGGIRTVKSKNAMWALEELRKIAKMGKAEPEKMFQERLVLQGSAAGAGGLAKMFAQFWKNVFGMK